MPIRTLLRVLEPSYHVGGVFARSAVIAISTRLHDNLRTYSAIVYYALEYQGLLRIDYGTAGLNVLDGQLDVWTVPNSWAEGTISARA
jgi:hypothetical protein